MSKFLLGCVVGALLAFVGLICLGVAATPGKDDLLEAGSAVSDNGWMPIALWGGIWSEDIVVLRSSQGIIERCGFEKDLFQSPRLIACRKLDAK